MSTTIRSLSIFLLVASLLCSLAFAPLAYAEVGDSESRGYSGSSAGGSKGYQGGPNAGGNAGGAQTGGKGKGYEGGGPTGGPSNSGSKSNSGSAGGSKGYQGGPNAGGNAGGAQTGGNGGGDREGSTSGPGGGANNGKGFGSGGSGSGYQGGPNAGGNAGGMQTGGSAPTKSAMSMARDAFSSAQRAVGNAISGIAKSIGSIATNQSTPAGEIAKGIRNAMQSLGISPSDVNTFSGLPSGYTAPTSITDKALSEIGVAATPGIVGVLNENGVSVVTNTTNTNQEVEKAFNEAFAKKTEALAIARQHVEKFGIAGPLPPDIQHQLNTTDTEYQAALNAKAEAEAQDKYAASAAQQKDALAARKDADLSPDAPQSFSFKDDNGNTVTVNSQGIGTVTDQNGAFIGSLDKQQTSKAYLGEGYTPSFSLQQSIEQATAQDKYAASAAQQKDALDAQAAAQDKYAASAAQQKALEAAAQSDPAAMARLAAQDTLEARKDIIAAQKMDARIKAVSRGPGLIGSLQDPAYAARALTSIGLALGDRYGLPGNQGIDLTSELARTLAGEVGPAYSLEENAAAARTFMNRMDLAAGKNKNAIGALMGYDANGYDINRVGQPNAPYKDAAVGTESFSLGLHAIGDAMSPYGSLENAPNEIKNATHYFNADTSNPSWGTGAVKYGAHSFVTPASERTYADVEAARAKSLANPAPSGSMTFTDVAKIGKRTVNANFTPFSAKDSVGSVVGTPSKTSGIPSSQDSDVNVDTDNDGSADTNIDTDNDGDADINVDTDNDGDADINVDTNDDGDPDVNVDTDEGKPQTITEKVVTTVKNIVSRFSTNRAVSWLGSLFGNRTGSGITETDIREGGNDPLPIVEEEVKVTEKDKLDTSDLSPLVNAGATINILFEKPEKVLGLNHNIYKDPDDTEVYVRQAHFSIGKADYLVEYGAETNSNDGQYEEDEYTIPKYLAITVNYNVADVDVELTFVDNGADGILDEFFINEVEVTDIDSTKEIQARYEAELENTADFYFNS